MWYLYDGGVACAYRSLWDDGIVVEESKAHLDAWHNIMIMHVINPSR
jgi:hypothetical protein